MPNSIKIAVFMWKIILQHVEYSLVCPVGVSVRINVYSNNSFKILIKNPQTNIFYLHEISGNLRHECNATKNSDDFMLCSGMHRAQNQRWTVECLFLIFFLCFWLSCKQIRLPVVLPSDWHFHPLTLPSSTSCFPLYSVHLPTYISCCGRRTTINSHCVWCVCLLTVWYNKATCSN